MSYGVAGFAEYGLPTGASVSASVVGGQQKKPGTRLKDAASEEYAWEKAYERPWEAIEEDEATGVLLTKSRAGSKNAGAEDGLPQARVQRGMMRHVFLVLDMSRGMEANDLKPSRAAATVTLAEEFVREYFDQNPISMLGLIIARDGIAVKPTELGGNPKRNVDAIHANCTSTSGDFSLQACLEVASRTLMLMPAFGTREVVLVHGAHSTCDPSDILETLATTVAAKVRVNIISLPGEMYIASRVAADTGGSYTVPENYDTFRGAMMAFCQPPVRRLEDASPKSALTMMGFPTLVSEQPGICACHAQLKPNGYLCPRCGTRACELPTACLVCGLAMVSAPSLARSYHHLFPVPQFTEVPNARVPGILVELLLLSEEAGAAGDVRIIGSAAGQPSSSSPSSSSSSSAAAAGRAPQSKSQRAPAPVGTATSASSSSSATAASAASALDAPLAAPAAAAVPLPRRGRRETPIHDASKHCAGCLFTLAADEARFVCPRCAQAFCAECDVLIHETLHNCPGCVTGDPE